MKTLKTLDVVSEKRFYRCNNGAIWTENAFPYQFWTRYLTVFSQVRIVARVKNVSEVPSDWQRVDGDCVSIWPLPYYVGLGPFVTTLPQTIRAFRACRGKSNSVIYRVPGVLSLFYSWWVKPKHYGVEVVGDPADTFAAGASQSVFRRLIRFVFINMLKRQCKYAISASYVTENTLQRSYPATNARLSTHYSSIQLRPEDFRIRSSYLMSSPLKLVAIGNLSQPYKGCDFLLKCIARLAQNNTIVHLTWIGGGALQNDMEALAKDLKIDPQVKFVGNLASRDAINNFIDDSDVFVLSSRQEGLPRVLIEAMARSLVCVATRVGGVPELLTGEFIVQSDNEEQMCSALSCVMKMTESQLLKAAASNYEKGLTFREAALSARRTEMYQTLAKNSNN